MNPMEIVTGLLNLLGAVGPELPALIAELKGSGGGDLTDAGKAALDVLEQRVTADEAELDALPDLPMPAATPTVPVATSPEPPPPAPTVPSTPSALPSPAPVAPVPDAAVDPSNEIA